MYEPEENSVMNDFVNMGYTSMLVSHRTGNRFDLIFQEQVRQLVDAVTFLLGEIGVSRVHLFGISMGASNAVSAAATDRRVASVAASSGISDCHAWLKQKLQDDFDRTVEEASKIELSRLKGTAGTGRLFEVTELLRVPTGKGDQPKVRGRTTRVSSRTIRSLLTYRPILSVKGIEGRPAFFFHGTKDSLVPHENSLAMYAAAKTPKYKLLIEGGDHGMILDGSVRERILTMYLRELRKNGLLDES